MTGRRPALTAGVPVAVVAVVAGVVSFGHIETLALAEHQPVTDARLLPLAVDGLIVAGSVILLAGYWLGWLGVVSGVAATLFANVESGLPFGPLAATVAAWPAIAFTVASFILERWLKRQVTTVMVVAQPFESVPAETISARPVPGVPAGLNGHAHAAAELFAADIGAGRVPGIRAIRSGLHVGQDKASQVQAYLRTITSTP